MNTAQRKFLVDKIAETTKAKIKVLKDSIPEQVSLNIYMLHKVMSNDFEIKPLEDLKKVVLDKAIKLGQSSSNREDWLGNAWGVANKKNVAFTLDEFFVIPPEYLKMRDDRNNEIKKIYSEIEKLEAQLNTLEIRIMVASDKTLQRLIAEIDDMGDISLIDTKIKLLE